MSSTIPHFSKTCQNSFIKFSSLLVLCTHGIQAEECSVKSGAKEAFLLGETLTDNGLIEKFDNLESQLKTSNTPIQEAQDFLNSYINQINIHYGSSMTIKDVCEIAKNNLDQSNISSEEYQQAIMILDLLQSEQRNMLDDITIDKIEKNSRKIYFPWEWKWFGLNKRHHEKKTHGMHLMTAQEGSITEIPGIFPFLVGLVEGSIGLALFPFNPVAGGILMGDGCTRIVQGIQENIQGNCENGGEPGNSRLSFPGH